MMGGNGGGGFKQKGKWLEKKRASEKNEGSGGGIECKIGQTPVSVGQSTAD